MRAIKILALGAFAAAAACSSRSPAHISLSPGDTVFVPRATIAARTITLPVHSVVVVYYICDPKIRSEVEAMSAAGPYYRYHRWLQHRLASCAPPRPGEITNNQKKDF